MAVLAQDWKFVVGFRPGGARRSDEESSPGTRHSRFAGCYGSRVLLRIRFAGVVRGSLKVEIKDRKSTRLNSSHQIISYAVFCFKKKKHIQHTNDQYPQ